MTERAQRLVDLLSQPGNEAGMPLDQAAEALGCGIHTVRRAVAEAGPLVHRNARGPGRGKPWVMLAQHRGRAPAGTRSPWLYT